MSEGGTYASLRQRYTAALTSGENSLRALLGSPSSSWKPVQTVSPTAAVPKEEDAVLSKTEIDIESLSGLANDALGPIAIHRRKSRGAPDIVRAVCTVPLTDSVGALDSFRAILATHSIREKWDPVVEKQEVLEIIEPSIKLMRTFTKIGWPGNPRDVVTVDKLLQDPGKTLIYLSVSLPRSSSKGSDDPPFLQPSPPYVRSHMHICAFVLTCPTPTRARLSMYWQWDLKASGVVWTNHTNAMPVILTSLVKTARKQASWIPYVRSWGKGVAFESDNWDTLQDRLDLHYGIYIEEAVEQHDKNHVLLEKSKERRRLERSIEIHVPPLDGSGAGWNLTLPTPNEGPAPAWQVIAQKGRSANVQGARLILRISHNSPKEDFAAFHIQLQRLAGGKSLKLNGEVLSILDVEERDPAAFVTQRASTARTPDLANPARSVLAAGNVVDEASHRSVTTTTTAISKRADNTSPAQKDLLAHIRRSYAHFLSLLQSPSAKWRRLKDLRNVSISSYIAIDPAMTPIYKYEATIVNTSIWDLLSVISSSGSRLVWDRHSGLERFHMLSELQIETTDGDINPNEQSAGEGRASFWEARWKPMWPTAAREAVFVRTTYRSPTTVHLLQSSIPDDESAIWQVLAERLSPSPEAVFRLHSQLQSVALDQISPTTASIVLVDQTNPKSWTKSGYNSMANAVANIGDFVLREGAPPLLTHLSGALVTCQSYEHDNDGKYELSYTRLSTEHVRVVESVLRLDLDVWSPNGAALSIEPPPSRMSAVLRHRLSEKGSGCWITVEHDGSVYEGNHSLTISVIVEKSKGIPSTSERVLPTISVNGDIVKIEREELDDAEIQTRRMQKRIANRAIMLDRSPTPRTTTHFGRPPSVADVAVSTPQMTSRAPTPSLHQRVSSAANVDSTGPESEPIAKLPIHYAFDALHTLQQLHKEAAEARVGASDWTILSYAENNAPIRISRRALPSLSSLLPLYRVERTLPGVSEEHVLRIIQSNSSNTRTTWDERLSSIENIAHYNNACSTSIWIAQPSFPTRSRIAYMANVRAQENGNIGIQSGGQGSHVTYVASSSVPPSAFDSDCSEDRAIVASERLNPSKLLQSSVPLEGWVVEQTTAAKDDEDEDLEARTYIKCSFYTCSDLPLMVAGSFGQAALRGRLARLFDLLESASKSATAGLIPRLPAPAMAIGTARHVHSPNWAVQPTQRCSSVIAFLANSVILKVRLPRPPASVSGFMHDLDSRSLAGGSGISQRSLGLRSIEAEASKVEVNNDTLAIRDTSNDIVVAEIILWRDSTVSGYDIRSTTTLQAGKVLPTDTSFWTKLPTLPFQARLYPASYLNQSAASYVLQVSLPTGQYTSPMDHPLSALAGVPALPRWYRKLSAEFGVIQLQATPVKSTTRADGRPVSTLRVTLDGVEVPVSPERVAPAGEQDWALNELVEVQDNRSPVPQDSSTIHPVLVNTAFLKHLPSRHKDALQSPEPASLPICEGEAPAGLAKELHEQPNRTSKPADSIKQPLVDLFTTTTIIRLEDDGKTGTKTTVERTYRLAFVILVAVISFLLGSLLRSLLSPGDYIFFTRPLDSMESAIWELLNPQKKWKYAMRLLQVPLPGFKWNFVAALVEND